MRTFNYPQEVIEYILGFLRGNTRTLAQCSLVCRLWRRPSQRELYRMLVIAVGNSGSSPCLDDFISFLSSFTADTPQRLIRDLTVCGSQAPAVPSDVSVEDIIKLISYLPALKSLSLQGFNILDSSGGFRSGDQYHLERLTFANVDLTFSDSASFSSFLDASGATFLFLQSVTSKRTIALDTPSRIRTLRLRSRGLSERYLGVFSRGPLDKLDIDCISLSDMRALGSFLASSPQITHLSIDITGAIGRARGSKCLHGTSCII